jgi:putative tricarboxylic transport membrane protein
MKKYIRIDGLIWVILGIGISIGSIKLKVGNLHVPGPGFMPFLSGGALGIFGLILIFLPTFTRLTEEKEGKKEKSLVKWNWKKFFNPLLTLLVLFVYLLLLEPLGFLFNTFIFLLFLFKLSEPRKWLTPLILSVAAAILSYLLFSVWLQIQFPRPLLRFW